MRFLPELQMATTIVLFYPFPQRYFIKRLADRVAEGNVSGRVENFKSTMSE
jgi:hypothetical protein